MFNKLFKVVLLIVLAFSFSTMSTFGAEASTNKVMWGKTELKLGQIGKVTINSSTVLYKLEKSNKLTKIRDLKAGEEFRVYSYKSMEGGLYGVGASSYIYKSPVVKYETPSKSKLALLSGKTPVVTLQKPTTPKQKPVVTKDKNAIYKEKLNAIKNTKYKNYKEYANAIFKEQSQLAKEDYNLQQESVEAYYHFGIEVDEVVISFSDGVNLLAYQRTPQSYVNNSPNNRSATFYNNEYYLSVPLLEYVLNAGMDLYAIDKNSKYYDGKFMLAGPSAMPSTEFKDESNKKLGYYNVLTLQNHFENKTLTISEKEYPFVSGGVNLMWSSMINPYSNAEVKEILGIDFKEVYDSKNKSLTFYFNQPFKDRYAN